MGRGQPGRDASGLVRRGSSGYGEKGLDLGCREVVMMTNCS